MNGIARLIREGSRFRVHGLRLAQHVHEQVDDQHAGEPVEHDRGDDDVAAALGLQIAGHRGPGGAEGGSAEDAEGDEQEARQEGEIVDDERDAEARQRRLALAADVEQPGMIGDRDGEADEDEIRHVEQGEAEPLPGAEAALDQVARRSERVLADAEHHEAGDEKRRHHGDGRHENRVGPFGQVDRRAHFGVSGRNMWPCSSRGKNGFQATSQRCPSGSAK